VSQFRLCPYCNSLERTRQALLYIRRAGLATKGATVLHFAPESGMKDYFRGIEGLVYVDTDLMMPSASVRSSITGLPFPDNSFSLIYCSHVLEHVPDDLAAMRELYRVLKPGGTALVAVPIRGATTYENPAVSTPEERFAHFGQSDHVRWYGLDIAERMAGVGFRAETAMMPDFLGCSEREKSYYQISQNHYLFLCHKPE
jgi:SAM-dependent methyltransferase